MLTHPAPLPISTPSSVRALPPGHMPALTGFAPQTARDLAERAVREAEALLRSAEHSLTVARAGIGDANRTSGKPVLGRKGRVLIAGKPFSAERVRERKAAAFRFLNNRRALVRAAVRRLADAQIALIVLTSDPQQVAA